MTHHSNDPYSNYGCINCGEPWPCPESTTTVERAYRRTIRLAAECTRLANGPWTKSSRRKYKEVYRQLKQARRILEQDMEVA